MVSEHTLAFAVGIIGNLISFMVFLAPITIFYRIYRNNSTEGFHSVPYAIALFSCQLWVYYALLKTNAILLITINSIGLVIETGYVVIHIIYAPIQVKKCTIWMIIFLNFTLFGLILAITLLCFHGHKRLIVLGWICVVFSVSVFIAPLSVMMRVIRTSSVEFMPFNLSLFLTISAAIWLAYGVLSKDKFVALPNIFGLVFGCIQMVIYYIYNDVNFIVAEEIVKSAQDVIEQIV